MSRKTSAYARKRKHSPISNGAAWLDSIQRSAPYSDEPIIGSWLPSTQSAATASMKRVRDAFIRIKSAVTEPENKEDYKLIQHAIGISLIRSSQIGGLAEKAMSPPLVAADLVMSHVLTRRRKWGKWEILPVEAESIDWAIEIYETIVQKSSPMLLSAAVDIRMRDPEVYSGESLEIEK